MYRTHTCGELRLENEGEKVTFAGWVHSIRTHGTITFIDLKDRYGITQITLQEEVMKQIHKDDVIQIKGLVVKKPEENKKIPTGMIEIKAEEVSIINKSKPLPIDSNATDDMRLKYRYIDIRNNGVLENLAFRSKVSMSARKFFEQNGFLEIETPLLMKSTPEGARDYVVPSRINQGLFYALPQSPQLYKQILMISGVDKYFQLAKCLRDEDLRSDRQPEHTQIDFEMSFVHSDDIRLFTESLMKHLFKDILNIELRDFPTFSYEEAMNRFGSDKPDIRFDLELTNVNEWAKKTDFDVFQKAETTTAIFVEKEFSRKKIDKYTELVKTYKAKGLAYVKINEEGLFEGGISKFIEPKLQVELKEKLSCENKTGTIFFVADNKKTSLTSMGFLRKQLGADLELINKDEFVFCWVNDFPLFAYNDEKQKWEPEHHMFSMPKEEFVSDFENRPGEVLGDLWDLVLNGWEMGSGSIRISNPEIQERIMNFVGIDKEEAKEKFGFLLEAYEYGGPVHGGMGLGLDRLVTLMLKKTDIREVIAFPKNKSAENPMDDSPGKISAEQLSELGISINKKN